MERARVPGPRHPPQKSLRPTDLFAERLRRLMAGSLLIAERPGIWITRSACERSVRRSVAISRAAVLPRLARGEDPVQAGGARRRLGRAPARRHDDRVHVVLRQARGRVEW